MSALDPSDSTQTNSLDLGACLGAKGKKARKRKSGKTKLNGEPAKIAEAKIFEENDNDDLEVEEADPQSPTDVRKPFDEFEDAVNSPKSGKATASTNGASAISDASKSAEAIVDNKNEGHSAEDEAPQAPQTIHVQQMSTSISSNGDTEARLDALARERDALREEVAQLRRSLEEIQEKHEEDLISFREQLEETRGEKEHAETQFRNLLGKVNTIKSQLGDRLKADAEDLAQARTRIEDLEEQCGALREENEAREAELARMAEEAEQRSKELSGLRNRTTLSQQNWAKEREDLMQRGVLAKEEFEAAKQAMQDWEILAMEERSIRESITEKVGDLEEQLSTQREAYERAASERDAQSLTVDGLQRALQEIQEARRRELRELVENSQGQLESLKKQLQKSEAEALEATNELHSTKTELERALPFEKEVKEKNLLIGKLRHEAVILNDHLTKALRYLKRRKPDDSIDRQLITNHFLHFLNLERSDPKKFQILQIIAALLSWTDEQREQAGLARPGASNPNLRVPVSPWHRTPSTPSLTTEFFPDSGPRKESLAELWSDFLEQEAQEGVKSPKSPSSSSSKLPL